VWKAAAMEGIKTYSGLWHKEKTAKWKVTQATAGKNAEESETLGLKRMMVLLYEMSASSFPAMAVANVITPSLNSEEEVGKALAIFQAALAVRRVEFMQSERWMRRMSSANFKQGGQRVANHISGEVACSLLQMSRTPVGGVGTYYSEYCCTECASA
jgi:hypothetical protein